MTTVLDQSAGKARASDLTVARRKLAAWLRDRSQFSAGRLPRVCPICGYRGVFLDVGHPPRWDARCPSCGSRERYRLLWLWATQDGGNRLDGKRILHFAPEKALRRVLSRNPGYQTADLLQTGVTYQVDITKLPMTDGAYDVVLANHVLEHIPDDRLAMQELCRILAPGGIAVLTVPVNPTREATYENPEVTSPVARNAHFNAPDHKRFYGLDFADRLTGVGFQVETFRMTQPKEVEYGLLPMEWLYIATRP